MKAIVCVDADWGIGKNNGLLVYNPIDSEVFRKPIAFSCGLETQANGQLLGNCQTNELQSLVGDMKYFKEKTLNKYVVMGRKTFESLPNSKPLKDRVNIVITRDKNYKPEGVIVFNSVFDFLISEYIHKDIYLIGGGQLYEALYNCCEEILVTKLDKSYEADTFFPNLDCKGWRIKEESETFNYKDLNFKFLKYVKRSV